MRNMELAQGSSDHDTAPTAHLMSEEEDEKPSALVLSSHEHEPPAPRGVSASSTGGGGAQTAEEQQAPSSAPVLLYPVNTERFFTTSADGKTYLKIAPASGMSSGPSDKPLLSGSDFSSKAVLCLIEAVGRRWGLYDTRERSQLFQSVQEEMASKGHVLPVEKIRRKWNNLIVTYKRVKDRSRETGHAKTSWEFFDLMDATLCDTVGSQISNNKRNKPLGPACPQPVTKIVVKPHIPQAGAVLHPSSCSTEGRVQASTTPVSSVTTVTISPSTSADIKPLIVLNGDLVTSGLHPTTTSSNSSNSLSAPSSYKAPSVTTSANIDLTTARFITRKAPTFSSSILPLRLSSSQFNKNVPNPSSSSISLAPSSGLDTPHKGDEQTVSSTSALVREVLKRQEEQAYLERVARRRTEAREKRRERREERMAESLGRVATALELLSSKQDTVIALLQRLADKK